MAKPEAENGWGLDGLWSDDFHHQVRRALAGDRDGYFADFDGSAASIAETVRKGWFYRGQHAGFFGHPRGGDPTSLDYSSFVFFIQNHDQIGNRAFGDRLHHAIDLAAYRAATVLLLLLPETPLLFMGQEWAATTPFQYFTDHHEALGRLVTQGRRREFEQFTAFSDPEKRETIPDPQALSTFERSKLIWEEAGREPHASIRRLYRELLRLRRSEPAMRTPGRSAELNIRAYDEDVLLLRRRSGEASLFVVVRLRGAGRVNLSRDDGSGARLHRVLSTEDPRFTAEPWPIELDALGAWVDFRRPGAVVLRHLEVGKGA
jgi:maltooligosyltrehalose trehalohydrolase